MSFIPWCRIIESFALGRSDRPSLFSLRAAITFFPPATVLVPSRDVIALQVWMNWEAVLGGGKPAIVFVSWL
jgi:hypothetical protein